MDGRHRYFEQIKKIDSQLVSLLESRFELSQKISEFDSEIALVTEETRWDEQSLIEWVGTQGKGDPQTQVALMRVFRVILDQCKTLNKNSNVLHFKSFVRRHLMRL